MDTHRSQRQIIPKSVPVPQVSHGVPFLAVNEHREQHGVSHEENRGVVAY